MKKNRYFYLFILSVLFFLQLYLPVWGAVVEGTSAGFVTVAPTADPGGATFTADTYARAIKDTSPAHAVKVVEIGWYCANATEAANFEVAIYSHDAGNNRPLNIVGVSRTNAKGLTAGWKSATVNIAITENTTYWIAYQLDDTTTTTNTEYTTTAGSQVDRKDSQTTLPDPWGSTNLSAGNLYAFYAVYQVSQVIITE
ncbi:MAG: hypothetical protein HQL24_06025 [Candidatus Omnitrophica bacterium]|nr:hypothetical protein [Candidatus Omnitrophota bacterium]